MQFGSTEPLSAVHESVATTVALWSQHTGKLCARPRGDPAPATSRARAHNAPVGGPEQSCAPRSWRTPPPGSAPPAPRPRSRPAAARGAACTVRRLPRRTRCRIAGASGRAGEPRRHFSRWPGPCATCALPRKRTRAAEAHQVRVGPARLSGLDHAAELVNGHGVPHVALVLRRAEHAFAAVVVTVLARIDDDVLSVAQVLSRPARRARAGEGATVSQRGVRHGGHAARAGSRSWK